MLKSDLKKYFLNIKLRGFTLVELLVYMGLVSILLLVLTQIFTTVLDLQLESESTSNVERDSRFIISRLAYDIHRATAISTPASTGTASGSLVLTINSSTYTYALDGTTLELTTDQGYRVNSYGTQVTDLQFEKIASASTSDKDTVKITLTLRGISIQNGGRETKTISTTVGLR